MDFLFTENTWTAIFRITILISIIIILFYITRVRIRAGKLWRELMPDYLNQMAKVKSVDYAPSGIITVNSAGLVISWNKGATNIFGYTEEELIGKSLTNLIPERYRSAHNKGIEKARVIGLEEYIGKTTRFEALRKNGQEFPIKLTLWQWKEGPNIYYTGIIRDVSEEVALSERDSDLLSMYREAENIDNYGVCRWNILTDIVIYSDGFKSIFNLDKTQSDSASIIKHVYYEDKKIVDAAIKKLFEEKKGYEIEYRIVDSSGRPKMVRSKTKTFLDSNGALQSVVAIIREIENNDSNRNSSSNSG